jgi:hypothetical protein
MKTRFYNETFIAAGHATEERQSAESVMVVSLQRFELSTSTCKSQTLPLHEIVLLTGQ